MQEMKEIWKPIIYKGVDYSGIYEVSNLGVVRSLKFGRTRTLKVGKTGNKYMKYAFISLCFKGKSKREYVHTLVFNAFVRQKIKGEIVDHIDGDCSNNRFDNLQILSQRQNTSKERTAKSGLPCGVHKNKVGKKYTSMIGAKSSGKKIYLGVYLDVNEAAVAYRIALNLIELEDAEYLIYEAINKYRPLIGLKKLLKSYSPIK